MKLYDLRTEYRVNPIGSQRSIRVFRGNWNPGKETRYSSRIIL